MMDIFVVTFINQVLHVKRILRIVILETGLNIALHLVEEENGNLQVLHWSDHAKVKFESDDSEVRAMDFVIGCTSPLFFCKLRKLTSNRSF